MLLRIDEPQLFKVNDDQGQNQYVYGENTDIVRTDLKLLIFKGKSEVVDKDAPQDDQKAGNQFFRKFLSPGNSDEHTAGINQKS